MDFFQPIAFFFIGLVLGCLGVWLLYRGKISHAIDRAKLHSESEVTTLTERLAGREQAIAEKGRAEGERRSSLHDTIFTATDQPSTQ